MYLNDIIEAIKKNSANSAMLNQNIKIIHHDYWRVYFDGTVEELLKTYKNNFNFCGNSPSDIWHVASYGHNVDFKKHPELPYYNHPIEVLIF